MRPRHRIATLLAAVSLAGPALAGPVVTTDLGKVAGIALGKGAAFRGIPFAAPPVGALRWREAQPARAWKGVRDASAFGAACIQPSQPGRDVLPQSEDCLTLNIVTPDIRARGLPVLFQVHGGAFFVGSGRYIAEKDLSPIVRRGVVLVSPNYRIGRMGFFAHPALNAEAGHGTGNFWLSDIVAALEWTKRNIARFGGDPGRTTISGCSAGGSAVNALMTSPVSRGLFARAAVHSGGGFFNATRPMDKALEQGLAFARRAGVLNLAGLRALTPAQVLAADPGPPDYGAIIDGHLLREPISLSFAAGRQAHVPLIVGSTGNEASVFGLMGFDARMLREKFGIDLAALRPLYERDGALSDAELLRRVQTDFLFTSAAQGMAALAARSAPAWAYHFDYVPAAQRATAPGAPHCADMPYVFGLADLPTAADQRLAEALRAYWYNFIAGGDPNGATLAAWPRTSPGAHATLLIGETIHADHAFERDRLARWFAKWQAEAGAPNAP